ncbi:polymer-forming cytoskeletal [Clostridium acetireducens DSM 10703]|jgi:cytoskeletal protein CcmA (bactofilin family)|uniref:Polymer-forming cytoskeletal n=1 Tax=Clostridium acetireducens DSM 10703 TaxID=1121290 RepID=A0A1E8EYN4_9CLOT|nr:polymer-forming cytoskeletal protein [Clostridium acetireducens]OFI06069.1 polymer-forming cytoskeletal [Clostridium acetireducens DSM 10703]
MFSSVKKTSNDGPKVETIIGTTTNITGNMEASGSIKVEGQFTGDINGKAEVIISETGYVKGNINAVNVKILGKIDGNINASGILEVAPTGKVTGDIETVNLAVEDGGIINGKCSMTLDDIKRIISPDENI